MAGHILLAEDDKALSALMQDFFRAAGVTVTPAYDGEQALVLAQAQPFDLLVLDVMMPHLNGLEVCEAVRQESDVPVIFVTALGQEGDTLAGFRAGADDYITKPFSFPVLVAKAQALMRRTAPIRSTVRGHPVPASERIHSPICLMPPCRWQSRCSAPLSTAIISRSRSIRAFSPRILRAHPSKSKNLIT